jgi:hypothetical protein
MVKAQMSPSCQAGDEEGMVAVQLKDGTWQTVSEKKLEMDIEHRDGVPYLVVRTKQ